MKTKIILIGVHDYESSEIPNLSSAFDNIVSLYRIFKKENKNIVQNILNCNTKSNLLLTLRKASKDDSIENLVIYYSGHSILDENNRLYLTVKDSTIENIDINGISIDELSNSLNNKNVVYIFDSCFSERAFQEISQRNFASIASSSFTEPSKYPLDQENSVFTGELIDILSFGINNSKPELCLRDIFGELEKRLKNKQNPEPRIASKNKLDSLNIIKNYFGLRKKQSIFFTPFERKKDITDEFDQSLVTYCLKDSISPKTGVSAITLKITHSPTPPSLWLSHSNALLNFQNPQHQLLWRRSG